MKVAIVLLCALFGLAASAATGRIVGGHNAGAGQFPYMVSLRSANAAHFCGGFIYNTQWIVSAAHCTVGRLTSNTFSLIGTHRLSEGGLLYDTMDIFNHASFDATSLDNDISLIRTTESMVMTATVQALRIGTANIGSGTIGVASAWGLTANPGYLPDMLQWVSLATVTTTSCRLSHTISNRSRIGDTNICTDNAVGTGMCTGGSGGPLAAGGTAIGIYSWGIPCATGVPDVYTRISSFSQWLVNVGGVQ